jgi:hypothetical protein
MGFLGNFLRGPVPINDKTLTWAELIFRIVCAYGIFSIISDISNPIPIGDKWSNAQIIMIAAGVYLMQFLGIYAIAAFGYILIARLPVKNRTVPLQKYLNRALILTCVILIIMTFFGWYGSWRNQNSVSQQSPGREDNIKLSSSIKPVKAYTTIQSAE